MSGLCEKRSYSCIPIHGSKGEIRHGRDVHPTPSKSILLITRVDSLLQHLPQLLSSTVNSNQEGVYSTGFFRFPINIHALITNSSNFPTKSPSTETPSSTSCGPSSLVPLNSERNFPRNKTTRGTSELFTKLRGVGSIFGSRGFANGFFSFSALGNICFNLIVIF